MRQIILASGSKARAQLLKKCGFKFKVKASNIKESKYCRCQSISQLVIHNALLKAKAIGFQFKSGVIVAADTIVLQNKKVFGKPQNKKEAFMVIKKLSCKPSYVYTGVAVIDIDNNKIYTDHEKTKVWLVRLSDSQINRFLSHDNGEHINFAGGLDIQERGSLFIERIEGCFYNVIGLPLVKVHRLLKECKIEI